MPTEANSNIKNWKNYTVEQANLATPAFQGKGEWHAGNHYYGCDNPITPYTIEHKPTNLQQAKCQLLYIKDALYSLGQAPVPGPAASGATAASKKLPPVKAASKVASKLTGSAAAAAALVADAAATAAAAATASGAKTNAASEAAVSAAIDAAANSVGTPEAPAARNAAVAAARTLPTLGPMQRKSIIQLFIDQNNNLESSKKKSKNDLIEQINEDLKLKGGDKITDNEYDDIAEAAAANSAPAAPAPPAPPAASQAGAAAAAAAAGAPAPPPAAATAKAAAATAKAVAARQAATTTSDVADKAVTARHAAGTDVRNAERDLNLAEVNLSTAGTNANRTSLTNRVQRLKAALESAKAKEISSLGDLNPKLIAREAANRKAAEAEAEAAAAAAEAAAAAAAVPAPAPAPAPAPPAAAPEAAANANAAAPKPGEWSKAMPVTTEWLNKPEVKEYLERANSLHLVPLTTEDFYFQKDKEFIYVRKEHKDIDLNNILKEAKATLKTDEGKQWTPVISERRSRPHNEDDPFLTITFTKDGTSQEQHPERPNSIQTGSNPYLQYHFTNMGNQQGFNYCSNTTYGSCLHETSITSGGRRKQKRFTHKKRANKTHKKNNRKAKTSKRRKVRKVSTRRR